MHQTQWVRVHAASFEEALAALGAQVERLGRANNWWKWTLARLPGGEVTARALEPWERSDLSEDDLALRDARIAQARSLTDVEAWAANAWCEVWSQLGLAGLSPIVFGDGVTAEERRTFEAVRAMPSGRRTRHFLEATLEAQRSSDARFDLDAVGPSTLIESPLRLHRAEALERIHDLVRSEAPDAVALPFSRELAPDDWPAHLLGSLEAPAFHLAVDMHL